MTVHHAVSRGIVFINCPFRESYQPLLEAQIFAVHALGHTAESALASSEPKRILKLCELIRRSDRSIHDLSLIAERVKKLPRMNVPFELGLVMGLHGSCESKSKPCLIFVEKEGGHEAMLSDLKGFDNIRPHGNQAEDIIREIRLWIAQDSSSPVPNHTQLRELWQGYLRSRGVVHHEMNVLGARPTHSFPEYRHVISAWVSKEIRRRRKDDSSWPSASL